MTRSKPSEAGGGSSCPTPLVLLDVDAVLDVLARREPFYSNSAAAGAEYVVTRNLRHFLKGPVEALAPAEFLPLVS
jgi:hypothetical protein